MAVTPNFWVMISLCKKECLSVITRNKKHSSKQVVSMLNTPAKDVFATVRRFFSDRVEKLLWPV